MDDDIASALPKPPPAAPARRQAAIDAALRRFDGVEEQAPAKGADREKSGWSWQGSQQAVGWAAAALVALIGVPAAWTYMGQNGPTSQGAVVEASNAASDVARDVSGDAAASFAGNAAAPAPVVAPPPIAEGDPASDRMEGPVAGPTVADRSGSPAAKPVMPPAVFMPAPPPPPPVVAQMAKSESPRDRLAEGAVVESRVAAPAPAYAAAPSANRDDIMVTAMRRGAPRSEAARGDDDWAACTINDPSRDLGHCTTALKPGMPGAAGRAGSHVADGLALAWQGQVTGAINAFDRAIAIAPRSSLAYLNRGLTFQRSGQPERAITDLDRAVRLDPSVRTYRSRGLYYRQMGDVKRARADEARANDLDAD